MGAVENCRLSTSGVPARATQSVCWTAGRSSPGVANVSLEAESHLGSEATRAPFIQVVARSAACPVRLTHPVRPCCSCSRHVLARRSAVDADRALSVRLSTGSRSRFAGADAQLIAIRTDLPAGMASEKGG